MYVPRATLLLILRASRLAAAIIGQPMPTSTKGR